MPTPTLKTSLNTEGEFGFKLAFTYLESFETKFQSLLENPKIGRNRNEIKTDLRIILKNEHLVFYRIMDNHIRIVCVLHQSRDLPKFFRNK